MFLSVEECAVSLVCQYRLVHFHTAFAVSHLLSSICWVFRMFLIASYSIMSSGSPGKLFRLLVFIQKFMHFILVWMAIFIYSTFKSVLYFISKFYCLLSCSPCKECFLTICRKGVLLWIVDSSFCWFSHSILVEEHLSNLLNSKCSSMLTLDRIHLSNMGDTLHVSPVLWQGLSVSRYLFRSFQKVLPWKPWYFVA